MAQRSHIHLDAVGGVAGDMFVAALLDACPDLQARVFSDVQAVVPVHCGMPRLDEGESGGIAVRRFGLNGPAAQSHAHGDRDSGTIHGTSYADLVQRISSAPLAAGTGRHAIGILTRLAEAESRLHRVPMEEVHFHELADWDSLMDVVAAGSIAAALAPSTWSVSDLPLGRGLVQTRHGLLPVPAPATAELLRGFRWRDDGIGGERVTPTGGAILAYLVGPEARPAAGAALTVVGIGAGTRRLDGMPNILRALVFELPEVADADGDADGPAGAYHDEVIVLSFDIDDMTGEEIGVAADRLRAAEGVLDLSVGARQGKKGRPSADFRLLIRPTALESVGRLCFLETSTIGLRWRREQRRCLARQSETIECGGGQLLRKRSLRPDGTASFKLESDAVAPLAGLAARRRLKSRGERGSEDA
jgi:pyridinium-3,5-bisthiocarboxylic acid mononucleotide nickel chelatase